MNSTLSLDKPLNSGVANSAPIEEKVSDSLIGEFVADVALHHRISLQFDTNPQHLLSDLRAKFPIERGSEQNAERLMNWLVEKLIEPLTQHLHPLTNVRVVINISREPEIKAPFPDSPSAYAVFDAIRGILRHRITASNELPLDPNIKSVPLGLSLMVQPLERQGDQWPQGLGVGDSPFGINDRIANLELEMHAEHNKHLVASAVSAPPPPMRRPDNPYVDSLTGAGAVAIGIDEVSRQKRGADRQHQEPETQNRKREQKSRDEAARADEARMVAARAEQDKRLIEFRRAEQEKEAATTKARQAEEAMITQINKVEALISIVKLNEEIIRKNPSGSADLSALGIMEGGLANLMDVHAGGATMLERAGEDFQIGRLEISNELNPNPAEHINTAAAYVANIQEPVNPAAPAEASAPFRNVSAEYAVQPVSSGVGGAAVEQRTASEITGTPVAAVQISPEIQRSTQPLINRETTREALVAAESSPAATPVGRTEIERGVERTEAPAGVREMGTGPTQEVTPRTETEQVSEPAEIGRVERTEAPAGVREMGTGPAREVTPRIETAQVFQSDDSRTQNLAIDQNIITRTREAIPEEGGLPRTGAGVNRESINAPVRTGEPEITEVNEERVGTRSTAQLAEQPQPPRLSDELASRAQDHAIGEITSPPVDIETEANEQEREEATAPAVEGEEGSVPASVSNPIRDIENVRMANEVAGNGSVQSVADNIVMPVGGSPNLVAERANDEIMGEISKPPINIDRNQNETESNQLPFLMERAPEAAPVPEAPVVQVSDEGAVVLPQQPELTKSTQREAIENGASNAQTGAGNEKEVMEQEKSRNVPGQIATHLAVHSLGGQAAFSSVSKPPSNVAPLNASSTQNVHRASRSPARKNTRKQAASPPAKRTRVPKASQSTSAGQSKRLQGVGQKSRKLATEKKAANQPGYERYSNLKPRPPTTHQKGLETEPEPE